MWYSIEDVRKDIAAYKKSYQGTPRLVGALTYDTEIPEVGFDSVLNHIIGQMGLPVTVHALRTIALEIRPESIRDFDHLQDLCRLAEVHTHIARFRRAAYQTGAQGYGEE